MPRTAGVHAFIWVMRAERLIITVGGFLGLIAAAHAQDLEPRAYANTTVGMNFIVECNRKALSEVIPP